MTGFINKKISSIQSLGEKLQKHRHEQGLSLEKASRAININVRYLRLLEKNAYRELPADVYTINILKHYAGILNLNPAMVVDLFEKEKNLYLKTQRQHLRQVLSKFQKSLNFFLNPKIIKYGVGALFLLGAFAYLGLAVNKIVSPPALTVDSPADNLITAENQIKVQGQTEKEVKLKINDRPLLSDKQGNFSLTLDLPKGLNVIKISAQKKHSKEQVVYRRVMVNDKSSAAE